MRKLVALAVALALLGPWTLAAQTPAPGGEERPARKPQRHPVAQYCMNRWKDFLDIFNVKVAFGDALSLLFHARATRFAQIGFGRFVGTKVGFQGPSAGIYGEGRVEVGLSVFYWSRIGRKTSEVGINEEAKKTNRFFGEVEDIKPVWTFREYYDGHRPWHTFGFAFALPFLPGIEAEVNPAEAVDFLLSFLGIPAGRVPPPFYKVDMGGEKIPARNCIRWHGQEEFEQYD